jgi:hypothetical protein
LIVGRVVSSTMGWSDESESFYPIIVIKDEHTSKPVSVHAFHAALQTRLAALEPKAGERIAIKMGPKIPLKNNPSRSVQTYVVRVEGRDEQVDWSQFKRERQPAPPSDQLELTQSGHDDDDIPF